MPTNSKSETQYDSYDPKDIQGNWGEMIQKIEKCPRISELENWLDASLQQLEVDFSSFSTCKSMRRNFGR